MKKSQSQSITLGTDSMNPAEWTTVSEYRRRPRDHPLALEPRER